MSARVLRLPLAVATIIVMLSTACGSDDGGAAQPATTEGSAASATDVTETTATTPASAPTTVTPTTVTPTAVTPTTAASEAPSTAVPTTEAPPRTVASGPLEVDCSSLGRVSVGLQTGSITSGGLDYEYRWTVPSTYDGSPLPVVLDFHGIGSNGAQQAIFAGWPVLAETEGFLAVEPTGSAVAGDGRASWELPQFDTAQRDDVAMVLELLDHIADNVCIDPARIYSTGMSNGALFTSVLVCDLSEVIAAAVSVAGVTHDDSCDPTRPVPYLAFHGTDDTTIPYRGGGETTLSGAEGGEFFDQVMPEEFAEFAVAFGCAESGDSAVSESVTLTSYAGCRNDIEMGFYTIDGGGHTWPGSPISAAIPSLGVTTMDVDATAIAWAFFQRQSL